MLCSKCYIIYATQHQIEGYLNKEVPIIMYYVAICLLYNRKLCYMIAHPNLPD